MDHAYPEIDFGTDPVPDFHERMAALREQGLRVVPVRYIGGTGWIILRHDDVHAAYLNEPEMPAAAAYRRHSEPAQGRTLLCMEGEQHRINRLLVSKSFQPHAVRQHVESLLVPLANELIDSLPVGQPFDVVAAYTRRYPFSVISRLLGIPVDDELRMRGWLEGMFAYPWNPRQALDARAAITDFLRPLVDPRRRHPAGDLLSLLATAEAEGARLTDEEIFSFVRLIFPAGADTTFLTLGTLVWEVLRSAPLREQLLERPGLRRSAVDEVLRLHGAIALQSRYTERAVTVAGVTIPADSVVLFGTLSANRDPAVFDAPDQFRLERPPRKVVTFGVGPHFCLGSHLARAELEVSLDLLLDRLEGLRLVHADAPGPTGAVLRGVRSLDVQFDARRPAPGRS
jgi:cytochrome P450